MAAPSVLPARGSPALLDHLFSLTRRVKPRSVRLSRFAPSIITTRCVRSLTFIVVIYNKRLGLYQRLFFFWLGAVHDHFGFDSLGSLVPPTTAQRRHRILFAHTVLTLTYFLSNRKRIIQLVETGNMRFPKYGGSERRASVGLSAQPREEEVGGGKPPCAPVPRLGEKGVYTPRRTRHEAHENYW